MLYRKTTETGTTRTTETTDRDLAAGRVVEA